MTVTRSSIVIFVAFACGLCGVEAVLAENVPNGFAAGPYLLDVTTESATVAFHLNKPASAKVRIFDSAGVREFESNGASASHFITVAPLKAGMTYNYQVVCDKGPRTAENDGTFQIRTACASGESFTFSVYGDPRPGTTKTTRHHHDVVEQMMLHEPLFSLVLGDMVDDGRERRLWEQFFDVEAELLRSTAIYAVIGDNDYAEGKGLFAEYFPKLRKGYYKFEWGGVCFFALNAWDATGRQSRREIEPQSPQVKWLEAELAKETVQKAPFRVVFLHDPVYICRGRSSELLRRFWAPIFRKYKVDVVFAAWHMYERSINEGVTYIISGGGGAELIWMRKNPMYPSHVEARRHHFCRVDVSSGTMTIRAIATDGTVLDSVTLVSGSQNPDRAGRLERAAKRLGKEITLNRQQNNPVLGLTLFSSDCDDCRKLLKSYLPRLAEEYGVTLKISYYDLGVEGTYDLLKNIEAEFGRSGLDLPAVFVGRSAFGSREEITHALPGEIAEFLEDPPRYLDRATAALRQTHDTATIKEQEFNELSLGNTFAIGLAEALQSCALPAAALLLCGVILFCRKPGQVLYAGGGFTAAVLLTYLVLGLAFFNLAWLNPVARITATALNLLLGLAAAALAGLFAFDLVRKPKAGHGDCPVPPDLLRGRFSKFSENKIVLPAGAVVLGVMVAMIQPTCTGRLYIQILTMLPEPSYRVAAVSQLLAYNLAFALPVAAVFLSAILAARSKYFAKYCKQNVFVVRLALAVIFALAVIMVICNLR